MQSSFIVRPVQANLIHQPEWTLKMDPFCKIFLGSQSQQTSVSSSGGKTPKWGDSLTFTNTGDLDLRVEVWDSDLSDQQMMIGSGSVNLTKIINQGGGGAATWVDLGYKGRNAGRLCLAIQPGLGLGQQQGIGQYVGVGVGQGKGRQEGSGQGISQTSGQAQYGVGQTSQGLTHGQGQYGHVMGTEGSSRGFGQQDIGAIHEKQTIGLQQPGTSLGQQKQGQFQQGTLEKEGFGQSFAQKQPTSFQQKQGTTHAKRQQGTSRGFGQHDISRPQEKGFVQQGLGQQGLGQQGLGQQGSSLAQDRPPLGQGLSYPQQGLSYPPQSLGQQGTSLGQERMPHPHEKQTLGEHPTTLGQEKHLLGQGTTFGQEKQGLSQQQQGLTYPPEKQGLGQGVILQQKHQLGPQELYKKQQGQSQQGQTYGTGGTSNPKH